MINGGFSLRSRGSERLRDERCRNNGEDNEELHDSVVEIVDVDILKESGLKNEPCCPDFISSFELKIPLHFAFSVN